jgi:flagellar FliL protein
MKVFEMADEKSKNNQEKGKNPDEKKGKGGLIKFILVPVVLLAQAVGAYFLVFNLLLQEPSKASEPEKEKKPPLQVGLFYEINDIVVNPAGTAGKRFMVMEIALETKEQAVIDEATLKEIWIRDAVISILTRKTPEELLDFSLQEQLKKEILNTMNRKMRNGKFIKIYFKKYIMQ